MGCLWLILAMAVPRLALFILWLTSDYVGRVFQSALWPILGFFFLPTTTLAYAFAMNSNGSVDGWYLVLVVLAVFWDLGHSGGSAQRARQARSRHG